MKMQSVAVLFMCLAPCTPAPPGKSTIAASDAMTSMAFNLKYLPVTVAEDNGVGNYQRSTVEGRVQTLLNTSYTARNCQLYSATGPSSSGSSYVSMTANGLGTACTYSSSKNYGSTGIMHKVFANNQVQCCNACVSTDGCVAATFETSSSDHTGGFGPQSWEGFGIHLPDVQTAKTTGGLSVDELKEHYLSRFGDFSEFDAFMDYSVTFFTYDLQHYVDSFAADGVKHFLGQWSDGKDTWYSLVVNVPGSTYVIELVSLMKPTGASNLPKIEQRMSSAHCDKFRSVGDHASKVLLISSINRAASDMSNIDDVHTNLFKAETTFKLDGDVVRRCYSYATSVSSSWGPTPLDEDVCFTSRSSAASKDAIFSVKDHEEMLWAVHAETLGSNPDSTTDKYSDSHYALPLPSAGLSALASYFSSNDPYPITKSTRLAYACKQNYLIDPTGFCIQPIGNTAWPQCTDVSV
jgi:hypothetical protein